MKIVDIISLFDADTTLTIRDNAYCGEVVFSAPICALKGKVGYTLLDALDIGGLTIYQERLLRYMACYADYSAHNDVSMEDRILRFSHDVARLEAKEGEVVVTIF